MGAKDGPQAVVLASSEKEWRDYAFKTGLEPYSKRYRYIGSPRSAMGLKVSRVLELPGFWTRQDAGRLREVVKFCVRKTPGDVEWETV